MSKKQSSKTAVILGPMKIPNTTIPKFIIDIKFYDYNDDAEPLLNKLKYLSIFLNNKLQFCGNITKIDLYFKQSFYVRK